MNSRPYVARNRSPIIMNDSGSAFFWLFVFCLVWCGVDSVVWAQASNYNFVNTQQSEELPDDEGVFPWALLRDRVSIHANAAFLQVYPHDQVRQSMNFRAYFEDATLRTQQDVEGGAMAEVGGSVRVWRQLGLGATYSHFNGSNEVRVEGAIPHPLEFSQLRGIELAGVNLQHRQRATHLFAGWTVPLPFDERLSVTVFGGPSLFSLRQGLVTHAVIRERGNPFTSVDVEIGTSDYIQNGVGVNVGSDVVFMPTTSFGIGFIFRYTKVSIDLPSTFGQTLSMSIGGFQTGGGLRFRF